MGKYAHFEPYMIYELADIYSRHAEVARDIHQDALRKFTGNPDLEVDLVRITFMDANPAALEKMSEYDVVSVSMGLAEGAKTEESFLYNQKNAEFARQFFELNDMPIYVSAAGNDGNTENVRESRLADFSRTSLVVGEANFEKNGEAYIEQHSSRINPTLAGDSPFNSGESYQYINLNPPLEGREELIRGWLVEKEAYARYEAYESQGRTPAEMDVAEKNVRKELETEGYASSQEVNDKIQGFMDNPQSLHDQVIPEVAAELRATGPDCEVDEKTGFVKGLNGTSFSGPATTGGFVSGVMYEQEVRDEQGLPILMKEEIVTLVKMSTLDTRWRENDGFLMKEYNNSAGNVFTEAGGHGVLNPEMFRNLLDKAYEVIETNPDIDREAVELKMNASIERVEKDIEVKQENAAPLKVHQDYNKYTANPTFPDRGDIVIDRVQFYFDMPDLKGGPLPSQMTFHREGHPDMTMYTQSSDGEILDSVRWLRSERQFGETLKSGEKWEMEFPGDYTTKDSTADIRVYGYNKGGLMDQMMEHSQKIAPNYEPKPDQDPKLTAPDEAAQELSSQTPVNGMGP